jgi:hypothetical protein
MEGRQERAEPLDRAHNLSSLSGEVEAVARGDRSMQQCPFARIASTITSGGKPKPAKADSGTGVGEGDGFFILAVSPLGRGRSQRNSPASATLLPHSQPPLRIPNVAQPTLPAKPLPTAALTSGNAGQLEQDSAAGRIGRVRP